MTLYDIMNKKPEELKINEVPAVAPVEEPVSVAVKENETPQVVTQEPKSTYKHTSWWQTPNYVEEQQKLENVAKKRMEADEKRARWQRNAAIIGDVAKLGLQSAALAGGSTKIDRFAPETTSANEKMQAIRDRNAAQIMEFAKQRTETREAERADKNARGKLEASLAASEAEREYKAQKDASDLAYKLYRDQVEDAQKDADLAVRQKNAETNAKRAAAYANGGKSKYEMPIVFPDGEVVVFSKAEHGDNWINKAYEAAVEKGMPRVMKVKTDSYNRKIEYESTNLADRKAALERWSAANEGLDLGLTDDDNLNLN